jgi:EAL and modified HD-GYP domain-containing signal transduction protein
LLAATDQHDSALAYAAGMLSAFELLLEVPVQEAFGEIPLDEELRSAAFTDATALGRLVRGVAAHQLGSPCSGSHGDVTCHEVDVALTCALHWAVSANSALNEKVSADKTG